MHQEIHRLQCMCAVLCIVHSCQLHKHLSQCTGPRPDRHNSHAQPSMISHIQPTGSSSSLRNKQLHHTPHTTQPLHTPCHMCAFIRLTCTPASLALCPTAASRRPPHTATRHKQPNPRRVLAAVAATRGATARPPRPQHPAARLAAAAAAPEQPRDPASLAKAVLVQEGCLPLLMGGRRVHRLA